MTVIDVDAHFEPVTNWLDDFPGLKQKLPERLPDADPRFRMNSGEMFAYFVSDDLLRNVPPERRMPVEQLTTPAMQVMFDPERPADLGYLGASQYPEMIEPKDRVAWLDEQGIATQNLISGAGYTLARAIADPTLAQEALEAINTWMTGRVSEYRHRLLPVTSLRYDDLDWVVRELTRMRERGSRAFLVSSEPAAGIPPNHPEFDRVWSAATDLGMIGLLHVGMSPSMIHPGWANTDDPGVIKVLSVFQPHQAAEVFLAGMVFGGVFERHPKLTILMSEVGIDWLAPAVARMDAMAGPETGTLLLGEYGLPIPPSEYVRGNVRISPLPAPHQSPVTLLGTLPEVAVFSSDFPHFEGNGNPIDHYRAELSSLDESTRTAFLAGNIAASYALMGDQLPV
jgi:uncharacterized protein